MKSELLITTISTETRNKSILIFFNKSLNIYELVKISTNLQVQLSKLKEKQKQKSTSNYTHFSPQYGGTNKIFLQSSNIVFNCEVSC